LALFSNAKAISLSISAFFSNDVFCNLEIKSPNPFLKSTPNSLKVVLCFAIKSAKKTFTACEK
jgi:hypothetical protein